MPSFSLDEYLKTFLNWESKLHQAAPGAFSLERVERLLSVFGRPDEKLRFAHVAGTKGKGSTCAFLASILRASGYRVGLYTSPHLHSLCERIRVLEPGIAAQGPFEGAIPLAEVEERLRYHHDDIEQLRASGVEITFYELMTVLAVSYFASKKVQVVVLETGLGGRLDATNVLETSVCGITPVGFDHMNILGTTLAAIAGEKAGIIRDPLQRVTLAPQEDEALAVLQERCALFGIRPMVVGQDLPCKIRKVSAEGVTFDVEGRRRYEGLVSPLTGAHQAENAALAIGMAEDLEMFGFILTEDGVREGISSVHWPARFERVSSSPAVIVDCAHTAESAKALAGTFRAAYPGRKAVVILGMSSDKDPLAVMRELSSITQALVLTKAKNPRSLELSSVGFKTILPDTDTAMTAHVPEALSLARRMAGENGIVLVTGSVFVCAEVRIV
jgi:dihydrofolate synthase/folylpolyglutamate synthase